MQRDNIVVDAALQNTAEDQPKEDESQETPKTDKECQALVHPRPTYEEPAFSETQPQGVSVIPSHGNALKKLRDIYSVENEEGGGDYRVNKLLNESDSKVDEEATIEKEILNEETGAEKVDQNVIEGASGGDVAEEEISPVKEDLHCVNQKMVEEVEECMSECENTYVMGEDKMHEKDKLGLKRKVKKIFKNIGNLDIKEKLGKKKKSGRESGKDIDCGQNEK